jgi:hypothetical protein
LVVVETPYSTAGRERFDLTHRHLSQQGLIGISLYFCDGKTNWHSELLFDFVHFQRLASALRTVSYDSQPQIEDKGIGQALAYLQLERAIGSLLPV